MSPSWASAPSVSERSSGVVHHRQPQHPGVQERIAQHGGRPHRRPVVGEPDCTGIGQLAEGRKQLATPARPTRPRTAAGGPAIRCAQPPPVRRAGRLRRPRPGVVFAIAQTVVNPP